MSQPSALYQWTPLMARQAPHLRAAQAQVVAAFRWGVGASRRCPVRLVAEALPQLGKPDPVERRWQRFVATPRGDGQPGAPAVARWVLRRFPARRPLGLVVEETSLPEAFRGMVGSVASRGPGVPGGRVVLSEWGVRAGASGREPGPACSPRLRLPGAEAGGDAGGARQWDESAPPGRPGGAGLGLARSGPPASPGPTGRAEGR